MHPKSFCQSCGMPLDDPNYWGSEKNGSRTEEYCLYCYQQGKFIEPHMTLDEMRSLVTNMMKLKRIPQEIIEVALERLPELKRWKEHEVTNVMIM